MDHLNLPNTSVKALPSVAGTRRKRRAPYLKRYANVLEDYAVALSKVGDANQAKTIEQKIATLRQSNPGKNAGFKIVRFNPQCAPNTAVKRDAPQAARPLP